jgi:hypothetical protein
VGDRLLIWSAPLMMLDNVLRPVLIRRGVQLPLLLVVAGVIGGLIGIGSCRSVHRPRRARGHLYAGEGVGAADTIAHRGQMSSFHCSRASRTT